MTKEARGCLAATLVLVCLLVVTAILFATFGRP